MADVVLGKDCVLFGYKDGDYYPFACAQEMTFTKETETIPTTTITSGAARTYRTRLYGYRISFSGLLFLQDLVITKWHALELFTSTIRINGLNYKIIFTDTAGNYQEVTGHALVPNLTAGGVAGQMGKWSAEFLGNGEFTISGINGSGGGVAGIGTGIIGSTFIVG